MAEFEHSAHPHAALMAMYAQDAARTASPELLWQYKTVTGDWENFSEDDPPLWIPCLTYRRHTHPNHRKQFEPPNESEELNWRCDCLARTVALVVHQAADSRLHRIGENHE